MEEPKATMTYQPALIPAEQTHALHEWTGREMEGDGDGESHIYVPGALVAWWVWSIPVLSMPASVSP